MVLLVGDLGAGKTAFAQGFAAALGVEGPVTSPTFALCATTAAARAAPCGRSSTPTSTAPSSVAEVADLALAELVEEDAVALVEWGDRAAPAFDESTLVVALDVPDRPGAPSARAVEITGRGSWAARADEVAAALERVGGPGAR